MNLSIKIFFLICCLLLISSCTASNFVLVGPNIFSTNLQLKNINGVTGTVSPTTILGNNTKNTVLGVVQANLVNGKYSDNVVIQTYPGSQILISDDFLGNLNYIQFSSDIQYPIVEVYYGYGRSTLETWVHYFRIESIDNDYAYVVFADFNTKSVWKGTIDRSVYDSMVSSGKIPDWNTITGGL